MAEISFSQLLTKAERKKMSPNDTIEQRVSSLTEWLYSEEILPTRRACQHYKSHHHFSAALILWADKQFEVSMKGCRSTTHLATIGSAQMATWLDRLVRKGFLESDSARYKADGKVRVTQKLMALFPVNEPQDTA